MVKDKKGITLIALIITVIIMLILSGVAISMITTDGIPFGKIKEAAGQYNNAVSEEEKAINNIIAMLNGDNNNGGLEEPPAGDENITYTISPTTASKIVTITFTTETEYNIEYKIGESSWVDYSTAIEVSTNGAVNVRLKDSGGQTGSTKTINITNIDTISPNAFDLSISKTTNSITVSGSTEDTASAGATSDIAGVRGYQYKIDNENWTEETPSTSYTFSGLTQGSSHTVSMRAIDNAGNIKEATNKNTSVQLESPNTIANLVKNGTIKVGDWIAYEVGTGTGTNNGQYTMTTEQTGYGSDQTYNVTNYTGGWRVLYADTTTGILEIVSVDSLIGYYSDDFTSVGEGRD